MILLWGFFINGSLFKNDIMLTCANVHRINNCLYVKTINLNIWNHAVPVEYYLGHFNFSAKNQSLIIWSYTVSATSLLPLSGHRMDNAYLTKHYSALHFISIQHYLSSLFSMWPYDMFIVFLFLNSKLLIFSCFSPFVLLLIAIFDWVTNDIEFISVLLWGKYFSVLQMRNEHLCRIKALLLRVQSEIPIVWFFTKFLYNFEQVCIIYVNVFPNTLILECCQHFLKLMLGFYFHCLKVKQISIRLDLITR